MPYPASPTDAQPVVMKAWPLWTGRLSILREPLQARRACGGWGESRWRSKVAVPEGGSCGARPTACDLRGGAALVVAGAAPLRACTPWWRNIRRGYEDLASSLA